VKKKMIHRKERKVHKDRMLRSRTRLFAVFGGIGCWRVITSEAGISHPPRNLPTEQWHAQEERSY
jgi:hypothetical protein